MSDQIEERWREKYYDKVSELNAAEAKLQAAEKMLGVEKLAHSEVVLALLDKIASLQKDGRYYSAESVDADLRDRDETIDQLREALALAVKGLEYVQKRCRHEQTGPESDSWNTARTTLAQIRAKVEGGK